jgi:hypothetical protein
MTDDGRIYAALLDASRAVLDHVYGQLDDETVTILDQALAQRFRLATLADASGTLVVLFDQQSGQVARVIASVNAKTGTEKLYALRRTAQGEGYDE